MDICVISNSLATISNAASIILDMPFCTFLSTSIKKIPGGGIAGSKRISILIVYRLVCRSFGSYQMTVSLASLRDSVFPQREHVFLEKSVWGHVEIVLEGEDPEVPLREMVCSR